MIKPVGFQIVVTPYVPEEKTKAGLYLPDSTRDMEKIGTVVAKVVAMGPSCFKGKNFEELKEKEPRFKVGDWVLIGKFAGTRYDYEGAEYRIMPDDTPLAIVEDPSKVKRA